VTEFKVPELGEDVTTGDVLRVLVKAGDTIKKEQPAIELETDKATIEVPSSVEGVVTDIRVKPGDKVQVGDVILTVDEAAGANRGADANVDRSAEMSPSKRPAVEEGAQPAGSAAAQASSASAASARPEPSSPRAEPQKEPPKVVSMPRPSRPEPLPAKPAEAPRPSAPAPRVSAPVVRADRVVAAAAAPGVRRLAREIGVDINDVQGAGIEGRISEEDVKEHARQILSRVAEPRAAAGAPAVPLPDFERWGPVERQPMSNIRRTTAQRLSHAWNAIPHVTQFDKADITGMEELRRKYREQVRQAGGDLTVTAVLVKVLAVAVKQFPQFNSSIDAEADQIIYKKYVNIGVAVDTDRGLLVPVIRDAGRKNLTQIGVEVHQLAQKARERKLTLEEMSGGGLTISNLGGIGGTYFTPIVNWPEVAILGVSRGMTEPVWRNTTFEPRQLLPLSLSYDHRVIDGADAMRFLRWVVEAIEQPFLLSLLG
jgi:pyruvate dehydrogenase E2 component (dihydrolipoyllysine-residue acetyltransferase)